jgi:hypothetical protein
MCYVDLIAWNLNKIGLSGYTPFVRKGFVLGHIRQVWDLELNFDVILLVPSFKIQQSDLLFVKYLVVAIWVGCYAVTITIGRILVVDALRMW